MRILLVFLVILVIVAFSKTINDIQADQTPVVFVLHYNGTCENNPEGEMSCQLKADSQQFNTRIHKSGVHTAVRHLLGATSRLHFYNFTRLSEDTFTSMGNATFALCRQGVKNAISFGSLAPGQIVVGIPGRRIFYAGYNITEGSGNFENATGVISVAGHLSGKNMSLMLTGTLWYKSQLENAEQAKQLVRSWLTSNYPHHHHHLLRGAPIFHENYESAEQPDNPWLHVKQKLVSKATAGAADPKHLPPVLVMPKNLPHPKLHHKPQTPMDSPMPQHVEYPEREIDNVNH